MNLRISVRARWPVLPLALGVAAVGVTAMQASALAAFDPYTRGSAGYDYSYLQCGAAAPRAAFGVVGVNAGYPFT